MHNQSVEVERVLSLPGGTATTIMSYPRASCDEFDVGRLVVLCLDTGRELDVYEPHQWKRGTMIDELGYPIAWFTNTRLGKKAKEVA